MVKMNRTRKRCSEISPWHIGSKPILGRWRGGPGMGHNSQAIRANRTNRYQKQLMEISVISKLSTTIAVLHSAAT